jgi:hypothetical protein
LKSQWKRLALAAFLSLGCASATVFWYFSTQTQSDENNSTPLAQVSSVNDEVLRRPPKRLLWQQLSTGDNLYNGESIRTSEKGELQIQFMDGRSLHLEPDTFIVIAKTKDQLSLDLVEGSFVANGSASSEGGEAAPKLVLNSKKGAIDLSSAKAAISKTKGKDLDLQVFEGKAKVGEGGQEIGSGQSFGTSSLKILAPLAGKPVFIQAGEPVAFKWQGVPPNWRVTFWSGATRSGMKESEATGEGSELKAKLPIGKHWWKLVAFDPANPQNVVESAPLRVDIQELVPPTLLAPTPHAEISAEKFPADLNVKWQRTPGAQQIWLEIAKDATFKQSVFRRAYVDRDAVAVPSLAAGDYYIRLSALYPDNPKPVTAPVVRFRFTSAEKSRSLLPIAWKVPANKLEQEFAVHPELEVSWEPKSRKDEISLYRLKFVSEGMPDPIRVESDQTQAKAKVPKAGRYIASVEAYDKAGNLIGKSEPLSLAAKELALLPPPILIPESGALQAAPNGQLDLNWKPVEGAKEYSVSILKGDQAVMKLKTNSTSLPLKKLLPGEYTVRVEAVDQFGRSGRQGVGRPMKVPEKSGLKAPKMKKIQVVE